MEGFIKFFGTGGARFVAANQIRATGGLWLNYKDTNLYIDPGPGAVVRIRGSKDHFDPSRLDGIILTHKHLDHANDVNIMIEAMTNGGFTKKGVLFCPNDAVSGDPVVLKYATQYIDRIEVMKEKKSYTVKDVTFETPVRHIHGVETYGLIFNLGVTIGLISDTKFFDELPDIYHTDYLIVNVLRVEPIDKNLPLDHLSFYDFASIISKAKPKMAIMTHFGFSMIKEKPWLLAEQLKKETGVEVVAAYDGMKSSF
ncbi:MAG: MBL fold metallo-hydrolase [Syntrophobacterales bacterium]|jgi:phosphoribosyl 1,2-cyclic phosphodiesterase|nr:MBL fold metallo-hydrolase [Syntrophobacterales bacterium]